MKTLTLLLFMTLSACAENQLATANTFTLPDHKLTPGQVDRSVDTTQVCTAGYTAKVRNVTDSTKRKVVEAYLKAHPTWPKCKPVGSVECEIDHLISLELGGSNDITNLWPEPPPGSHQKDVLENYLHRQVCQGTMTLKDAQKAISGDWTKVRMK